MMISPEGFIDQCRKYSYEELLVVRDKLLHEIKDLENHTYADSKLDLIDPSPEVVYQCKLEYLGKLCAFIAEKYRQEYVYRDDDHENFLDIIRNYLESKGLGYNTSLTEEIAKRKAGKKYSISDHLRGMIYSMMSNQTKWYRIEPHLEEIDELFYNYDPDKIVATDSLYFCQRIFEMKCGNMSTKAQMESLKQNIRTLRSIESKFGSIDSFIFSGSPEEVVQKLSSKSSPYKLGMIGEALAWEYLRNVGIDGAKPDTHLRRFFGSDRMGNGKKSPATIKDVNEQVEKLSKQTGMTKVEIDNLIWSFCSDGYGEICTAKPHCEVCPIKVYCNYQ